MSEDNRHWHCYLCGGPLVWQNDWDSSDIHGWSEDDGGIVTIWVCNTCGREYTITDPERELRETEYKDYWKDTEKL